MRHYAFAAAIGVFTVASFVPCGPSHAASVDPTGYWVKPNSERTAKILVTRCGRGLCSKIAWLEDPNDSHGRPLRDIRNDNPSLRGRSIVGLPIFSNLMQSAPGTWAGKIYNPEDGHTYSVTVTMVSKREMRLRGCKNWLMCAERTWFRTAPPPKEEPAQEPQIEASAEPKATPAAAETAEPAPTAVAKAEPAHPELVATPVAAAMPVPTPQAAVQTLAATPAVDTQGSDPNDGYRFLAVSTAPDTARLSGENLSSMFTMTRPLAQQSAAAAPAQQASLADEPVPMPQPKPKAAPKAPIEASAGGSLSAPAASAKTTRPQSAPAPQEQASADEAQGQSLAAEEAETAAADPLPLTRRQKRLLRRQQMHQPQPLLPWLR
jgi:uncharacterized protein (DUF2147 family)